MASMGLKYLAYAEMATDSTSAIPTYEAGDVLGQMVSTNLSIANSEGELYADDMLAEYVSEFESADFTAEVDNIPLSKQATLYGATYENDEFKASPIDVAPYFGIGGYQSLMIAGVRKYRAWFYPKARATMPDLDGTTKGKSISFGTQPIKMKIMAPKYGHWYYSKEFTTEAAAKAYIDNKLGVATWYTAEVQVQGATTGEGATPEGVNAVASGEDFVVTITGTVTKLYDNGSDATSSIAAGAYTVADIAANHKIAVIF